MIKFARKLVGPGKTVYLCASDVYLKRTDDVGETAEKPNFNSKEE